MSVSCYAPAIGTVVKLFAENRAISNSEERQNSVKVKIRASPCLFFKAITLNATIQTLCCIDREPKSALVPVPLLFPFSFGGPLLAVKANPVIAFLYP